jgi:hypothetical protein
MKARVSIEPVLPCRERKFRGWKRGDPDDPATIMSLRGNAKELRYRIWR